MAQANSYMPAAQHMTGNGTTVSITAQAHSLGLMEDIMRYKPSQYASDQ